MEPARSTAASGHAQRPPRTYRTGAVTRWIRIATVGFTAIVIAVALIRYPALPDSVPTHFGITGEPDAWGPPSSMFLLLAILAALVGGMTWLSFHPRYFNFPVEITDDSAQTMYRLGEQMIVWVTACCALMFTGIICEIIFPVSVLALTFASTAGLFVMIVVSLVRMFRMKPAAPTPAQ
ncbi:hypothetical protein FM113_07850 [Leucobacter sp. 7(1)]|uniref:DUF1648 domain-containing protein n=1 Tax=Leucobacter sp. 7(1) TaxID=1255613 RepID=UPI00097F2ED3|nr:DUF1648 domain-containing protein [Leucobacter sp. 7(1)]SJN09973.1 hypothetical protein FM113_07850 [Leucobacter sp. 7(1)]